MFVAISTKRVAKRPISFLDAVRRGISWLDGHASTNIALALHKT